MKKQSVCQGKPCCEEVKGALVDLFINVKIRNDSSMQDMTSEKLEKERGGLQEQDCLSLIECIRKSIEILISMKVDEENMLVSNRSLSSIKLLKGLQEADKTGDSHSSPRKDPGKGYARILDDIESQKSEYSTRQGAEPPKAYEEVIQKLEGDIRMHIRIEQQMRLHIDNLSQKIEDLERAKTVSEEEFSEEMQEIKREKRRLNDLLTLREEEIAKIKNEEGKSQQLIKEREGLIIELERKVKHIEKKYEKALKKLQAQESEPPIKKVSFRQKDLSGNESELIQSAPKLLLAQHANLVQQIGIRQEQPKPLNQNFVKKEEPYQQDIQQLRQEYKKKRGSEISKQENRNVSQICATSNSSNNSNSYAGLVPAKKKSKVQEYQPFQPLNKGGLMEAYQKALDDKTDEINNLKQKLCNIQTQVVAAKRQSTSSDLLQKKAKKTNHSVSSAYFKNAEERPQNSGHKRAKTHLNFQNPYQEMVQNALEGPKILETVTRFDMEKENFVSQGNQATFLKTYRENAAQQMNSQDVVRRNNSSAGLQPQTSLTNIHDSQMNKTVDMRENIQNIQYKKSSQKQPLHSSRTQHSSQRTKSGDRNVSQMNCSNSIPKKEKFINPNYQRSKAKEPGFVPSPPEEKFDSIFQNQQVGAKSLAASSSNNKLAYLCGVPQKLPQ